MRRLVEVVKLLNGEGVQYWIDSGTLLGVIRDGSLIESETDIDIGIWREDSRAIEKVFSQLHEAGYKLTDVRKYNDVPFQYRLRSQEDEARMLDIHVYFKSDKYAWSPLLTRILSSTESRLSPRYYLFNALKYYLRTLEKQKTIMDTQRSPWNLYVNHYTWCVPADYFDEIATRPLSDTQMKVPANPESYLEFRYGDWETPVDDWNYKEDDNAVKQLPPEILIGDHSLLSKQ